MPNSYVCKIVVVLGWCLVALPALAQERPKTLAIRDKAAPADWKRGQLSALLPEQARGGSTAILVWEVVDRGDELPRIERCLIIKTLDMPTTNKETHALGYFERLPKVDRASWRHPSVIIIHPTLPSEIVLGSELFKTLPTDADIVAFLKKRRWADDVNPGEKELKVRPMNDDEPFPRVVKYTPKLLDGGVCLEVWKKAFGRDPPADLFPELAEPMPKKMK